MKGNGPGRLRTDGRVAGSCGAGADIGAEAPVAGRVAGIGADQSGRRSRGGRETSPRKLITPHAPLIT
jgi:hypothetical protein